MTLTLALIAALAVIEVQPARARGRRAAGPRELIAPGMELGGFRSRPEGAQPGSEITVLRVDVRAWEPVLLAASQTGETSGLTARQWASKHGLAAATNAGMFATDFKTHVGYMRSGDHLNNPRIAGKYNSVAAFGPRKPGIAPFRIFDLDADSTSMKTILENYSSAVQNLRLIKRPGENRWPRQEKRWSEAALGEDGEGRMLLIFCRAPFSMHDFNEELLPLGIGVVAAQHLEGGPEAQLFIEAGGTSLELIGSYETSFRESDDNEVAWKVPNILGIRSRAAR